jgi:Asp-tRNA(Asn)/Glu-tRNA(Gln) amidotransferase A subunit family amidase
MRQALAFLIVFIVTGCGNGGEDSCTNPSGSIDITEKTVVELQDAMSECQVNSVQLVNGFLDRIEAYDQSGPVVNAMITVVDREQALEQAQALDEERNESGPRGMLHGIPVIVKDAIDVEGLPTSGGTTMLPDAYPPDSAHLVAQLEQAGAIVLGKTNLDEFQQGGWGLSTLGGQTLNPYDSDRSPGGSSAGSAAGIAANFAVIGIGADTQGSIRFPAMHNNLCGLRPTRGLIGGSGGMPSSVIAEVKGPMTRTMTDLAHTLDIIAGFDPDDPISSRGESHIPSEGYASHLDPDGLQGARIGYIGNFVHLPPDTVNEPTGQVLEVSNQLLSDLEQAGATLVRIDLTEEHFIFEMVGEIPTMGGIGKQRLLWDEYLATLSGVSFTDFQDFVNQGTSQFFLNHPLIERTIHVATLQAKASETYDPAMEAAKNEKQLELQEAFAAWLDSQELDVDAVLVIFPGKMPVKGPDGHFTSDGSGGASPGIPGDDLRLGLSSYLGLPTLILPAGFTSDGIPIGFHLIGRAFSESRLIEIGYSYEQATGHRRLPGLTPALSSL